MEHLEENNLEALQEADQFVQQRHQRKVFVGYKEDMITRTPFPRSCGSCAT